MPRFVPLLSRWILPIAVVLWLIGLAIWRGAGPRFPKIQPLPSLDSTCLMARASLLPLPALQRVQIPLAVTWEMPMGSRSGAFTYNAQEFGAMNTQRGGYHLGDDINGIGQENTDLGDPVYAAADGLVVYAGVPSDGWAGVVIVMHRTEVGEKQIFYGHLEPASLAVVAGERLSRGRLIGRLGLSTAVDYAHLHLELRNGATIEPGAGYASDGTLGRENALDFLRPRIMRPGLPVLGAVGWGTGLRVSAPASQQEPKNLPNSSRK